MNEWLQSNIKKNQKIVLLEIGCGINPHSLRINNGKMMSGEWKLPKLHNITNFIRINPSDQQEDDKAIHLKTGCKNAITHLLLINS